MRVISKSALVEFWIQHPNAQKALEDWYHEAAAALWKTPQDIKARYASASFLGHNRVVFVAVAYRFSALYVKFVGTHAQYDAIQALTVELKP